METDNAKSSGNYLVFARKWRPLTFADVSGQQHIVRALQNAIKLNRFPNAYIFSGIRGVGKTSLARILARSINCEKGPTVAPCGECAICNEIVSGSSIDVIEIDGASNNGVDDIREIREALQYAPAKCRMKIYIVDEVHMLSKPAFNAFLKTLEEPPPHTLFIFATTELTKIPETVLSRCQCFEFRALSELQIAEKLKAIADKEKLSVTDTALKMISRRAEGSMRDAESLMDQLVSYSDGEIGEEEVGMVLGLVSRDRIWSIINSLFVKDSEKTLAELHDLYYTGYDTAVILREMLEAVRELTIVKLIPKPESIIQETPERIVLMKEMVKNVSPTKLQQFYDLLTKAEYQGKMASNDLSVLEMALLKMNGLDDVVPVDELLKILKSEGVTSGQPAQAPRSAVSYQAKPSGGYQPPAQKRVTATPPVDDSPYITEAVEKPAAPRAPGEVDWNSIKGSASGFLATALANTTLVVNGENATLFYPHGDEYVANQCQRNKEFIETEINKHAGRKMTLSFQAGEPVASEKKKSNGIDNAAKLEILKDPLIAKAIDIFEGRPEFEE
ncbi:MAG: DNA polymerase III subunit gamma/tau [Nitrospinota bacterium]|nr:DNA polymerase III subunit gamma/tau [Nitrospinota bacterium]